MPEDWPISEDDFTAEDLRELENNASSGDALACYMLGTRLITGEGVSKDVRGGLFWYLEAIKHGHVMSKWNAGSMFVDGEDDIPANQKLGLRLIVEAAKAGDSSACLFLSRCYELGRCGYKVDKDEAEIWRKSAWGVTPKEFDRPWDPAREFDLKIERPIIRKS